MVSSRESLQLPQAIICSKLEKRINYTLEMQVKHTQKTGFVDSYHFGETCHIESQRTLQKCTSVPCFSETTDSSTRSIDSEEEEYRQNAIKWILSVTKRVAKDTHYLAISYLNRFLNSTLVITQQNYELVAMSALLLATKMNEIYPPKIGTLVGRSHNHVTREDVIKMEGTYLLVFGFDLTIEHTPYTQLLRILGSTHSQKVEECERLLRIVSPFREIYALGDELLAYAIIYLIIPQFVRDLKLKESVRIKTLAVKIYNIYMVTKERYEKDKENRLYAAKHEYGQNA